MRKKLCLCQSSKWGWLACIENLRLEILLYLFICSWIRQKILKPVSKKYLSISVSKQTERKNTDLYQNQMGASSGVMVSNLDL